MINSYNDKSGLKKKRSKFVVYRLLGITFIGSMMKENVLKMNENYLRIQSCVKLILGSFLFVKRGKFHVSLIDFIQSRWFTNHK